MSKIQGIADEITRAASKEFCSELRFGDLCVFQDFQNFIRGGDLFRWVVAPTSDDGACLHPETPLQKIESGRCLRKLRRMRNRICKYE